MVTEASLFVLEEISVSKEKKLHSLPETAKIITAVLIPSGKKKS